MATAGPIDPKIYEEWAKQKTPGIVKRCPWMHGDIRKPLRVTGPKRAEIKLAASERATYERCTAAMSAGVLFSWSIDQTSRAWLVKVSESEEWRELTLSAVVELLDGLDVPTTSTPAAKSVRKATSAPQVPVVAPPAVPTVTASFSAGVQVLPPKVAEYVDRLVHEPKREYAAALAGALVAGGPAPEDPGTEWAAKVRVKLDRLVTA